MNNSKNCRDEKVIDEYEDDEVFDDSTFLANFANTSFDKPKLHVKTSNGSLNKNDLNVSALCCDEELNGYDKLLGQTWIYPTNYPVRDYQFNIINAALVKNTLVSLPTGLGKTFIAAVVMYNFYRWYPLGKIVFTAPTRPLVAQQIDACYNIVAIPPRDTIEMTGHMQTSTRKLHWQNKRVFFATPQVIYNDIKSGICPGDKIRCLVIDEAHRARKNYAYCQIINALDDMGHKTYRILALSATPGSKVDDVVNVVKSLHIANLELRSEECIDVARYSHSRKINTVIIPLGTELTHLKQRYVEILDCYARRLKQLNILPQNLGNLSKGRIVMMYKDFQTKDRSNRHPQHNYIMKDFMMLIALFHGLELLTKHGSRVFLNFFDEHPEKSWIQSDDKLTGLLEQLRDDLGINPMSLNTSILPDGTIPEIPKNLSFGHPKFYKLKEIMMEHFTKAQQNGQDTRAIVFCEYRESVNLVHCLLLQCRPLITPQTFVGQGASGKDGRTVVSQPQQLRVMRAFRAGACNTLVATCVAEEGLDVGSVDLILCFDISTRSPVRLVQRCGRTGRERGGQVYILVTEGREHQTLMDCMRQRDGLNAKLLQSNEIKESLYKRNPRMMPHDFTPKCQMLHITVAKRNETKQNNENCKKGQKNIRSMLLSKSKEPSNTTKKSKGKSELITNEQYGKLSPETISENKYFAEHKEYWSMDRETYLKDDSNVETNLDMSKWLELQRTLQDTVNVEHSEDTVLLTELLQFSKTKKNELKNSQNSLASQEFLTKLQKPSPVKSKQARKRQKITHSPGKKNGDIRALFSTATKSTKSYTKLINDLGLQNDNTAPVAFVDLLVDLNLNNSKSENKCYICENLCECKIFNGVSDKKQTSGLLINLNEINLPDVDLIDYISSKSISEYRNRAVEDRASPDVNKTDLAEKNVSANFDLDLEFDSQIFSEKSNDNEFEKDEVNRENNFDIGELHDIFANSSPLDNFEAEKTDKPQENEKKVLSFFGLDSVEDIFADYEDSFDKKCDEPEMKDIEADKTDDVTFLNVRSTTETHKPMPDENPLSPSILSGRVKVKEQVTSPILCSQKRKFELSTKKEIHRNSTPIAKKSLLFDKIDNNASSKNKNTSNTTEDSMFTITQVLELINKTKDEKALASVATHSKTDINDNEDNLCVSPILPSQTERKKLTDLAKSNRNSFSRDLSQKSSIIISDSDSDSKDTVIYDAADVFGKSERENNSESGGSISHSDKVSSLMQDKFSVQIDSKRKLEMDDDEIASPYFNKKPKLTKSPDKQRTLKEKILASVSSFKVKQKFDNFHCSVSQSNVLSQKENRNPQFASQFAKTTSATEKDVKGNLEFLQNYRRDPNKLQQSLMNKFSTIFNNRSPEKLQSPQKRKIALDDSDDDFILDDKNKFADSPARNCSLKTIKIKKKKKKCNSYLDLEAELSDEDDRDSGDELSDESVGSIIDFICDDNVTQHEDVQALYLKTTKSPLKQGGFKIPELPRRLKEDILSQFVEEDSYEMDSFCVDSHIGLTQVNEVSALEVAEMVLEKRRKKKKKSRIQEPQSPEAGDSPLVKRSNKNCKRSIQSDSDDSS